MLSKDQSYIIMGLKFQSLLVNCLRKFHKLAFTYTIIGSIDWYILEHQACPYYKGFRKKYIAVIFWLYIKSVFVEFILFVCRIWRRFKSSIGNCWFAAYTNVFQKHRTRCLSYSSRKSSVRDCYNYR